MINTVSKLRRRFMVFSQQKHRIRCGSLGLQNFKGFMRHKNSLSYLTGLNSYLLSIRLFICAVYKTLHKWYFENITQALIFYTTASNSGGLNYAWVMLYCKRKIKRNMQNSYEELFVNRFSIRRTKISVHAIQHYPGWSKQALTNCK